MTGFVRLVENNGVSWRLCKSLHSHQGWEEATLQLKYEFNFKLQRLLRNCSPDTFCGKDGELGKMFFWVGSHLPYVPRPN